MKQSLTKHLMKWGESNNVVIWGLFKAEQAVVSHYYIDEVIGDKNSRPRDSCMPARSRRAAELCNMWMLLRMLTKNCQFTNIVGSSGSQNFKTYILLDVYITHYSTCMTRSCQDFTKVMLRSYQGHVKVISDLIWLRWSLLSNRWALSVLALAIYLL